MYATIGCHQTIDIIRTLDIFPLYSSNFIGLIHYVNFFNDSFSHEVFMEFSDAENGDFLSLFSPI